MCSNANNEVDSKTAGMLPYVLIFSASTLLTHAKALTDAAEVKDKSQEGYSPGIKSEGASPEVESSWHDQRPTENAYHHSPPFSVTPSRSLSGFPTTMDKICSRSGSEASLQYYGHAHAHAQKQQPPRFVQPIQTQHAQWTKQEDQEDHQRRW